MKYSESLDGVGGHEKCRQEATGVLLVLPAMVSCAKALPNQMDWSSVQLNTQRKVLDQASKARMPNIWRRSCHAGLGREELGLCTKSRCSGILADSPSVSKIYSSGHARLAFY